MQLHIGKKTKKRRRQNRIGRVRENSVRGWLHKHAACYLVAARTLTDTHKDPSRWDTGENGCFRLTTSLTSAIPLMPFARMLAQHISHAASNNLQGIALYLLLFITLWSTLPVLLYPLGTVCVEQDGYQHIITNYKYIKHFFHWTAITFLLFPCSTIM